MGAQELIGEDGHMGRRATTEEVMADGVLWEHQSSSGRRRPRAMTVRIAEMAVMAWRIGQSRLHSGLAIAVSMERRRR